MIDCRRCVHYQVTWDKRAPHGCRAMGFKSPDIPSRQVAAASGTACRFFEKKERPGTDQRG